ncbi:DCL family protein [Xanthomonas hydrangeae]|uniref:DCL family protein n=1 Tax=Xanthomonas hydrangeae TaxID=2775159 RepID=A0AAU0BES1_9XANT|nr:DCL family protein [Xanthomonas hydrangeae]WOB50720.1 DCL family protein [Xanthomonas hydrangeae]
MGVKKPVTVGIHNFEKQGDALEFFSKILWRYKVDEKLSDADAGDVNALLGMHRDVIKKIGPGIEHFVVMRSEEGSRCFGVVRLDGQQIGFSYKRCITGKWD